jgi:pimeloyl-ACP methyl ester carboxylesterase
MPGAGHNVSQHNPEAVAAELALFFLPLAGSRA